MMFLPHPERRLIVRALPEGAHLQIAYANSAASTIGLLQARASGTYLGQYVVRDDTQLERFACNRRVIEKQTWGFMSDPPPSNAVVM
jgi:hypothetical protein